jgi:lysophospholipase L1-like esterase
VPANLYRGVTDIVFDALADALLDNLHQPQHGVYVVNTRNTIARAAPGTNGLSGDWINEIHPDAHGYALLARKIAAQLAMLGIN